MNKAEVEVEVPVLIRNSESDFKERLQAMDVFFANPLTLFKTLVRKKFSFLQNPAALTLSHAAEGVIAAIF